MKPASSSQNGPTWRAVLSYLRAGHTIIGIDEVGRGAWAGPVVAAAVILPPKLTLVGVRDSKLLSPLGRTVANRLIRAKALAIGIGWVAASEVDEHGLSWAVQQSGLRAIAELTQSISVAKPFVILDGSHNYLQDTSHASVAIVAADALVTPVAAASIVAKVARDRYMAKLESYLPGYSFGDHKGYGTALHRAALAKLGATNHHRYSYKPLAGYVHH